MNTPADVAVGIIGRAHGVRGDLFVQPWTDTPELRFRVGSVLRTEPTDRGPLTVRATRSHSGKLVVHFDGIDDRGDAEAARGTVLVISASERAPIEDPDEFYDTDLIGLQVRLTGNATVDGRTALTDGAVLTDTPVLGSFTVLGSVHDVLHSSAGSLLSIHTESGAEVLVPFLRQFVPEVDLAGRYLVIEPPDGLLEL